MPSDEALLKNAVRCARGRIKGPRWVAVMEVFAVGSTSAQKLCERFGFNPDERVRGAR